MAKNNNFDLSALESYSGKEKLTINTARIKSPLTNKTSNKLYWAKYLSNTSESLIAKTEEVVVNCSSSRKHKETTIDLLPEAPDWLWAFPPQLDDCGLYSQLIVKGISFRLRYIPSGRFLMGSPNNEPGRFGNETQHTVNLTKGYWLGETTVTQVLWEAVMGSNPSVFKAKSGEFLPVENVRWDDCQIFCEQVNKQLPGLELTLPTEAQWEYACRAGSQTPFSTGGQLAFEQANYAGNQREKTVAVNSFQQNPWGLYQMHGNVWEWCLDAPRTYTQNTVTDIVGDIADCSIRALRGGSWVYEVGCCRSASRHCSSHNAKNWCIGLRVAHTG